MLKPPQEPSLLKPPCLARNQIVFRSLLRKCLLNEKRNKKPIRDLWRPQGRHDWLGHKSLIALEVRGIYLALAISKPGVGIVGRSLRLCLLSRGPSGLSCPCLSVFIRHLFPSDGGAIV